MGIRRQHYYPFGDRPGASVSSKTLHSTGGGSPICACVLSEQLGPLRPLAQQTKEQRHTAGTKSRENGELTRRPGPAAQWGALKVLPLHCSPDPLRPFSPIPLKRSTKWVGAKPDTSLLYPRFLPPTQLFAEDRGPIPEKLHPSGAEGGGSVDTGPRARWPPPIPEAGSPTQAPRSGPL